MSLAVACGLRLQPVGPPPGRPDARTVVGAGRAGRGRPRAGRPARDPAASPSRSYATGSTTGSPRQTAAGFAARRASEGEVVGVVGTSIGVLVLLARRPAMAAGLAGRGRAACMAALVVLGVVRLPARGRAASSTHFSRCRTGELRTEILAARGPRRACAVDEVLVADASRRTTTLNAYVSGFGGTRRVVVYDTLVESLPQDQALSVVAHELAHAVTATWSSARRSARSVRRPAWDCSACWSGPGSTVGERGWERRRWCRSCWRLWRSATVLSSPVQDGHQPADRDAGRRGRTGATSDPDAFVEMQRTLALRSIADPNPPAWSQWWWGTHPTVLERVGAGGSVRSRTEGQRPAARA